jgi:hypothetical protein
MSLATTLPFGVDHQSIWPAGVAEGFSYSFDAFSVSFQDTFSVVLPSPLADASLSAQFESGLSGSLAASLGFFSLAQPVSVNALFPNSVARGQTFTIDTSTYTVKPGSLFLTSPFLSSSLDLDALAQALAAAAGFSTPPLSGSIGPVEYELLDVDLVGSLSLGQSLTFKPTAVKVDMSRSDGRPGDGYGGRRRWRNRHALEHRECARLVLRRRPDGQRRQ